MRNPFLEPHTPEQWLLSSVCLATICLLSWASVVYCSEALPYGYRSLQPLVLLVGFAPTYFLAWKKAVLSPVLAIARFSAINCAAIMWLIVAIAMQIAWIFLELFLLAFSGGMPNQD
jgi:hypothetical protein